MAYQYSSINSQRAVSLARNDARATLIEDEVQSSVVRVLPRNRLKISSPASNDSRQPKTSITPSSDATSEVSSMWSKRDPSGDLDDELYNVTDDESVEVPLIISDSIKRKVACRKPQSTQTVQTRYPSLIIPSPGDWPTPPKGQKPSPHSVGLSPSTKFGLSPGRLSMLNAWNLQIPSSSATPSLDGSLTSEELAMSSCPSTPDLQDRIEEEGDWRAPLQLDPDAFEMLRQINPDVEPAVDSDPIIEVSQEALNEMREIVRDSPIRRDFGPPGGLAVVDKTGTDSEPVSALSVPSPGGFFSSLHASSRNTWWSGMSPLPSTSTAEQFYGVPWRAVGPSTPVQQVSLPSQQTLLSPSDITEVAEIITPGPLVYRPAHQNDLQQSDGTHIDRTKLWLNAQWVYLAAIRQDTTTHQTKTSELASPTTPETIASLLSANESPLKKSVRFIDAILEEEEPVAEGTTKAEPLFFQGFQYLASAMRGHDSFLYWQIRAEAAHIEAISLSNRHCHQIRGDFEVKEHDRPAPARPVSTFLPAAEDDKLKEIIATAERERQALEQIMPSAWELQAAARIFGSQLITSPAIASIRSLPDRRILDYGGQSACEWGWAVALQYPRCFVTTVPSTSPSPTTTLTGPPNHTTIKAANPWTLPFPSNHFDLISARCLHSMLRTNFPQTSTIQSHSSPSEYDLVLTELLRVLKPSGYLEFNLLDAALLHPGPLAQALSVEFSFNLKTRGYDAAATRTFLPRLRRAGFRDVKRCWMVLPVADVTPRWVDNGKAATAAVTPGTAGSGASSASITPRAEGAASAGGGTAGASGATANKSNTSYFPPEKTIGPQGQVDVVYEPPLTGSTRDVRAMTGLVGARAWERWMVKLTREMGGSEERAVARMGRALEEAGKGTAGWRCLVGWARKAE